MSNFAIKVESISKRYRIGMKEKIHDTLGSALISWIASPLSNFRHVQKLSKFVENDVKDIIWALRDISFEVGHGDVIGIIGKNGTGKSTLLKILARITEPTSGTAKINGRVASLLEVGTGFHPELTGRENVFLNGTILGMTKREIKTKFDEIVDFSGIEKFIDTPVKRYSSGMRVRLAFAVAAHLNPEILLIDEVLAVGDTGFQKKCIDKMGNIAEQGRTVLFVSHNMAAVQSLCSSGILLSDGKIAVNSSIQETVNAYINKVEGLIESVPLERRKDRVDGDQVRLRSVSFIDELTGEFQKILFSGRSIIIEFEYINRSKETFSHVNIGISIFSSTNHMYFACSSQAVGKVYTIIPGNGKIRCRIAKWPLNRGQYQYSIHISNGAIGLDLIKNAGQINVESGDFYGTGKLPGEKIQGVFVDYEFI